MSRLIAVTREVSPALAACELTHLKREPIDVERARRQHAEYERTLEHFGCRIERLAASADLPDSVFVEDAAMVFDEIAIVARPGAISRRPEIIDVAAALTRHRPLARVVEPGTVDGGDVLVVGRAVFVGRTGRTNDSGIEQVRAALAPYGYTVVPRSVRGCLHLKSAVTALDDRTLLVNRRWIADEEFSSFDLVDVDPSEPAGANIVRIGDRLLYAAAFPRTLERLADRGYDVTTVDVSEIAKAEGAVTCCSVIFRAGSE